MSATKKDFPILNNSMLETAAVATGSVSGDRTTITSIIFTQTSGNWLSGITPSDFPKIAIIDGKQYRWTINETVIDGIMDNKRTYVKKATLNIGTRLTINKPFFKIVVGANPTTDGKEYYFSFYDLGNLSILHYQGMEGTYELDGKTALSTMIETENDGTGILDTKLSRDATYRFTWTLKNKSTVVTKKLASGASQISVSYTPPASWCSELPDVTFGTLLLKIEAVFGTQTYQKIDDYVVVKVPESFVPKINSIQIMDTMKRVPADWGMFIQNNSNIAIKALDISTAYGSEITSVVMEINGKKWYGTTNTLPASTMIGEYGIIEVSVTVKDKRQRSTTKSAKVTFVEYQPPTLQVDSPRCDEHGSTENDGQHFLAKTVTDFSPCNGKNSITLQMWYKITSDPVYSGAGKTLQTGQQETICGGDLDLEFSYDVKYVIRDKLNVIEVYDYVSTGVYTVHFLHGGRGIAFGQKATKENTADFAFDAIFRGKATFLKDNGEEVTFQQIIDKLGL